MSTPTPTFAAEEATVLADLVHTGRRKIPALTGIRGYAALWVVIHHCVNLGVHHFTGLWPESNRIPFLISGYLGVDLFFILSGFVLTMTYGSRVSSINGIRDFAIGRLFRILPIYWMSLLFFLMITPIMAGRWVVEDYYHGWKNMVLAVLLVQSWIGRPTVWNAPGWSLSAEWLAYFVFPLLAAAFGRLSRPGLIAGIGIGSLLLLRLAYHHLGLTSFSNVGLFGLVRCGCEFTLGIVLARLHQLGWDGAKLGTLSLVSGLVLLLPPMFDPRFDFSAVVAFAALVLAAGSRSPRAHALFGNRVAHFLGEISFSIYVLHWPLLELIFRFAPGDRALVAGLAVLPVAVVPLAWLTWRWIEVPGQAAGRQVVAWLRARKAAVPIK